MKSKKVKSKTKLKKADKAKMVAALRSGDYLQGTGKLKYEDSDGNKRYCCLGVACSIGIARKSSDKEFCTTSFLDFEIQRKLSEMNDTGKTFNQIATWIKKNL